MMLSFGEILSQGVANAWLFIPSAVLLGALHGLEPGHSKTMMAAFIVAIRGTVRQAIFLGLSATLSHTVVVWGVALGGLYLWQDVQAEETEPYFQLASGGMIVLVALWMLVRTWVDNKKASTVHQEHAYVQDRIHGGIDTGHGILSLELHKENDQTHWRVTQGNDHGWKAQQINVETENTDGRRQLYSFVDKAGVLESLTAVPPPHEFMARLSLTHGSHAHHYDISFLKDSREKHHRHEEMSGLMVTGGEYQDAHELAHANDIRQRFADRNVTTGQIILFGLTGGLIPCPAAITVLLLCLQVREFALGATLVVSFSVGLAITLVTVGAAAALSLRHATKRFVGLAAFMRKAPYFSGAIILLVGVYIGLHGWFQLSAKVVN